MPLSYQIPPGVSPSRLQGRPLLSTAQGGQVAVDATLLALWQQANGHTLEEVLISFQAPLATPQAVRAALGCLCQAGLLGRQGETGAGKAEPEPSPAAPQPVCVSAIIVNYNSQEWLAELIDSLRRQSLQPAEIIVVDNGSAQDPAAWLTEHAPQVIYRRIAQPVGLAHAINQGCALAQGEYFLLLNPDVRLEAEAVARLVAAADGERCAAVAAKLRYWWAPGFLNGLGNQVSAASWGADIAQGHLDLGQFGSWQRLPSACFATALLPRQTWQAVGALDENFPLYYEDSEWCYRARLLGYEVRAAPQAVAYHALGRRIHTGEQAELTTHKLSSVTYGRLRFALKLLSAGSLGRFFLSYALQDAAYWLLSLLRGRGSLAGAVLSGWWRFLGSLGEIRQGRRRTQAQRTITDRELFSLQRQVPPILIWQGLPELTWDSVLNVYLPLIREGKTQPIPEMIEPVENPQHTPHLLIISQDIVGEKMAGPGMRYLEMGRALASSLTVTLAFPVQDQQPDMPASRAAGLFLVPYRHDQPAGLKALAEASDVILLSSFILEKFPFLKDSHARLVVDLYDPQVLENLHYYEKEPLEIQDSLNQQAVEAANRLVRLGDYFICGNERQRDFWLGVLAANGRVNPHTFAQDASLHSLIDVVGVGFPDRQPVHSPLLRGVHPAFTPETHIVLWGGGIWDWLDPLSLVQAWPRLLESHPEGRLVFLGTRHPNPLVPQHYMAEQTIALADQIGEHNRTIFFFEWLPYEERESLLCEADVGVALHPLHVETRYSIRTRVLDYLWAGLPVLVTQGDITSEWVSQRGLGEVVPPLQADAVAAALKRLLDQPKAAWQPAFAPLKDSFAWPRVVEPLRQYCLHGAPAPDRHTRTGTHNLPARGSGWSYRLARARYILRSEGWRALLHRTWRYIQWKLAQ